MQRRDSNVGIFASTLWVAMNLIQKAAEKKLDNEYKSIIYDKYREAEHTLGGQDRPGVRVDPAYHYGPYYIVYARRPNGIEIYPSFTESHVENIGSKLLMFYGLRSYCGKVSIREPIPIVDIIEEITYPEENIDVRDDVGYPLRVQLGMWPNRLGVL